MSKKKKIQDFINRLVMIKHEAGKLELWKTMHSLEEPQRVVGWEFAEKLKEL